MLNGELESEAAVSVTVYGPGEHHLRRTMASQIDHSKAITLDGLGKLYVANSGKVTVYRTRDAELVLTTSNPFTGSNTPSRTIKTVSVVLSQ
jgi:hypothetical protein